MKRAEIGGVEVEDRPPFRSKSTLNWDAERRRADYGSNFTIVRPIEPPESGVAEP